MLRQADNRSIRVLQFLEAYEKQECLWNPSLESYKNKAARDEAYIRIIRELNVPSLTIHDVKLKVKSIRTTYTKELRLLTKHKEDGKSYNPKLFWFNRANSFLKNVSLSRDKRGIQNTLVGIALTQPEPIDDCKPCVVDYINLPLSDRANLVEVRTSSILNGEDTGNTIPSSYEYKTLHTSEQLEEHLDDNLDMTTEHVEQDTSSPKDAQNSQEEYQPHISSTIINSKFITNTTADDEQDQKLISNGNGDDEFDVFCRSVAAQLRSISDTYSRSVAKLKIQQILFEAETGHYRNSPCITIPVTQHINNF